MNEDDFWNTHSQYLVGRSPLELRRLSAYLAMYILRVSACFKPSGRDLGEDNLRLDESIRKEFFDVYLMSTIHSWERSMGPVEFILVSQARIWWKREFPRSDCAVARRYLPKLLGLLPGSQETIDKKMAMRLWLWNEETLANIARRLPTESSPKQAWAYLQRGWRDIAMILGKYKFVSPIHRP